MPPRRPLAAFFIRLVLIYGGLAAAFPVARSGYSHVVALLGNAALSSYGPAGRVQFAAVERRLDGADVEMRLSNVRTAAASKWYYHSHYVYFPTALTASLVLATPLPWGARLRRFVAAMAVVHLYAVGRLACNLVFGFSAGDAVALWPPNKAWPSWKIILLDTAIGAEAAVIIPIIIWIVTTLRSSEVRGLIQPAPSAGRSTPSG